MEPLITDPQPLKIITDPTIYLIGSQMVNTTGLNRFLEKNGIVWNSDAVHSGEKLVEVAGRTCYMSFKNPRPGGVAKYLDNILESGHGSVLEHGQWNFIIEGISRSCSHELVRHRAGWAYSQLSQRYVAADDVAFIVPWHIHQNKEAFEYWKVSMKSARRMYVAIQEKLMDQLAPLYSEKTELLKAVRQEARSVLPNSTETKIFFTSNARALRHFCELRGTKFAEREIRKVAVQLTHLMKSEAPNIFRDLAIFFDPIHGECVSSTHKKV